MISRRLSTTLILGSVALLAATQVWLSHVRYELSLETSRIQKEQSELNREIHQLNLELASLTRPERLRKIAQTELGMAPPLPMQVIRP